VIFTLAADLDKYMVGERQNDGAQNQITFYLITLLRLLDTLEREPGGEVGWV
jgi:hypothetical protein